MLNECSKSDGYKRNAKNNTTESYHSPNRTKKRTEKNNRAKRKTVSVATCFNFLNSWLTLLQELCSAETGVLRGRRSPRGGKHTAQIHGAPQTIEHTGHCRHAAHSVRISHFKNNVNFNRVTLCTNKKFQLSNRNRSKQDVMPMMKWVRYDLRK